MTAKNVDLYTAVVKEGRRVIEKIINLSHDVACATKRDLEIDGFKVDIKKQRKAK